MNCECGCGKKVKKGNKFIQGHNNNSTLYTEWNILNVISASNESNYVDESEIFLIDETVNPEKDLIKKESYQNLSDEAKQVIDICLNAPMEIMNQLKSPIFGVVSKNSLLKYFRKIWKRQKTFSVFQEVSEFVENF